MSRGLLERTTTSTIDSIFTTRIVVKGSTNAMLPSGLTTVSADEIDSMHSSLRDLSYVPTTQTNGALKHAPPLTSTVFKMATRWTTPLFALTTFLSAFLLFQVQPLLSKAILPWFGGSPAVWTVCMLFFQIVLFCGYVYAHLATKYLPRELQAGLHVVLLAVAASLGPITPAASWKPSPADDPTGRIMLLLTVCIGLPYFLLSATGPLLQSWFARINSGVSPYRLYALSNVGSLLALLSYPFAFEPAFDITRQGELWSWGFFAFATTCGLCALANALRSDEPFALRVATETSIDLTEGADAKREVSDMLSNEIADEPSKPTRTDWLLWITLPMTACVLLIAITNQVCQEVAVIPFLWIVPLTIYLLSFILTFDSTRWYIRPVFYGGLMISTGYSVWLLHQRGNAPMLSQVLAFFSLLFCGCMVCHGELVRMKPHLKFLTSFYLCISAGGALGGMFVGLLAPRIFTDYVEFHWSILVALVLPLVVFARDASCPLYRGRAAWLWTGIIAVLASLTITLMLHLRQSSVDRTDAVRNFFGVLKIEEYIDVVKMKHGGVLHGMQFLDPERRRLGTTYYSENSGIGLLLKGCRPERPMKVGLVGLGAGTSAVYGREGDHFRFYEINPEVVRFAKQYFSFLADCPAKTDIVLGDARLQMELEAPQAYDVIALDAFSGDGIPTHLLTVEAFDIYQKHLAANGVIAVHVSNRHLDLRPVLRAQAERLALQMLVARQSRNKFGAESNVWVLLTKDEALLARPEFQKLMVRDNGRKVLWTDARSDLMAIRANRE